MAGWMAELQRRNVHRAAVFYAGAAWLLVQVATQVFPFFEIPNWAVRVIVIAVIIGFPFAMVFSWFYEWTPQGIRRDSGIDHGDSAIRQTGKRFDKAIIAVLALAVFVLLFNQFVLPRLLPTKAAEAVAGAKSIAVLPFVSMSADKENEFFSDGVSEEILNSLARISAIRVVGRTSSFQFKGRNEDLRTIGRQLGVANVLEGSVRREGERARITAQLIRASDGTHLWSQTYDRTLKDTLAVQLDIAEQVAGALDVVLDDAQRTRMRSAGIENVDAFIHYQKGWKLYIDAHRQPDIDLIDGLRAANVEFEKATALAPGFSFAYFAETDLFEHVLLADDRDAAERVDAQRSAMRTLQRAADTSPDAQQRELALAERQMLGDDWRGLSERIEGALRQPGCSAPNWMPVFASVFGYGDLIEDLGARVSQCDPFNSINFSTRAWAARATGKPERVLAILAERKARGPVSQPPDHAIVAMAMLGRIDDARRALRARDGYDENAQLAALVVARLAGDDRAAAHAWQTGAERSTSKLKQWSMADAVEAALYGDRAEANRHAAAFDARPAGGLLLTIFVTYCGCGAPFDLDATPAFRAHLAESGLPWPPSQAVRYPPLPRPAPVGSRARP